jgi:hypothetical protein
MPSARDEPNVVYSYVPPMDHAPGWKASAFTWEMGEFILKRVEAGETIREITADRRMPAYCTVYQWVRVHPQFGARYRAIRVRRSADYVSRVVNRAAAQAFWPAHKAKVLGKRWWRRGKPSSYAPSVGKAICARLRKGATMMAINADPAMPSARVVYRWMRTEAEFRDMVIEARREWLDWLAFHANNVADLATVGEPLAEIKRRVARIEARIGRLSAKHYR